MIEQRVIDELRKRLDIKDCISDANVVLLGENSFLASSIRWSFAKQDLKKTTEYKLLMRFMDWLNTKAIKWGF
jgi:hypothetical protein